MEKTGLLGLLMEFIRRGKGSAVLHSARHPLHLLAYAQIERVGLCVGMERRIGVIGHEQRLELVEMLAGQSLVTVFLGPVARSPLPPHAVLPSAVLVLVPPIGGVLKDVEPFLIPLIVALY